MHEAYKNERRFLCLFKMAQGALLEKRWAFSLLVLKGEMEKLNKIKKGETKRRQHQQEKQMCCYCSALTKIQAVVLCATRYTLYHAAQRKGLDRDKGQRGE